MAKTRILVVEDESIVAGDIERRLVNVGYVVTAVVSRGEEALEAIEKTTPDLVLMDIALKGDMDGVSAAGRIQERFDIPVVYLTAHSDPITLQRAKVTDPFGYLLKPFEERELITVIEMALKKYQVEKELRNRERWLSTVLTSIGDAVVATDMQGCVTFMNPVAEVLTGWSFEDANGKTTAAVLNVIYEDARDSGEHPVKRTMQEGRTPDRTTNALLIAKDGARTPISTKVTPIQDDKGNITGTVFTFHDITRQVQAEAERDEQQRMLRTLVDAMPDPTMFRDRELRYVACNKAFCDVYELSEKEIIGKTDFDILSRPEDAQRFQEEDRVVLETGQTVIDRHLTETPRGLIWTESVKAPLRNEDGETVGVVAAARDITDRIRVLAERDEQRLMLRTLVDALPDAVLFKDRELRYVVCNKAFCDFYDAPEEEFIGKTDFDILSRPEDAEFFKAKDLQVLETGQTLIERHRTDTPQGFFWDESVRAPLRDEQGEIIGVVVASRDITDRVKAEIERDEQRLMLRALLDTTPDIVIFKDRDSVYRACSERYRELLGPDIPMDQFLGQTDFDLLPEDAQRYREEELQVMESREHLKAEHLLETSEGPRWFEAVKMPLRDEQGQIIGTFTSERDITDRLQAEGERDEQHRMLRAVLDTLPDFIIFKDKESVVRVCNKGFRDFLGLAEEEIIGKTDFDLFPPEDAQRYREEELKVMEAEQTAVNIHRLEGPDGIRWDEAIKTPLRDEQGEIMGVLTAGRDITEQKQYELEIKRRNRELTVLYETLRAASTTLDPKVVFRRVVHALAEAGSYPFVSAYMQEEGKLRLCEQVGYTQTLNDIEPSTGILGRLLRTGEPQFVPNASREPDFISMVDGLISEVAVPIKLDDEIVGALNVETNDVANPLTEADLKLMSAIADQLSLVMYNARLYRDLGTEQQRMQQFNEQLLTLQQISTAVISHLDLTELLDSVAQSATELLEGDSGSIFLFDQDDCLTIHGSYSLSPETARATRHDLGYDIAVIVSQTAEPVIVTDVPADPRFDSVPGKEEDFLSMISTPLLSGKSVVGTLNVHSSTRRQAFDEAHLHILSLLANQATVAIENARLYSATAESEVRYRSLFEGALDGIFVVDAETGYFLEANPAFQRMLGYSPEELRERTVWEVRAAKDQEAAHRSWLEFVDMGVRQGRVIPYQSKDEKSIEAEFIAQIIDWGGRQVAVAIVHDVTEKLQLEEQLRQSQKMEAIGTLAGGIAHDFNNLLGSVLGYASFVKNSLGPDDPGRADLEVIERSARRGADLTRQLLGFAHGGRYEVRPLSVNAQVKEVVQLLSRTVDKSIAINPVLDDKAALIEGDSGQINQLLLNLCLNACEAMPGGGFLTIETKTLHLDAETARRHIGEEGAGDYTLLTVSDTGHGMEPDVLEHLFEPFFSTKKGQSGKKHSGLGLATAFGIVKGHNGAIRVESEVGQGTTFKVWLPADVDLLAEEDIISKLDVSGGSETVMVVDDEESLRNMFDRVLSAAGYRVLLAADGTEALEIFESEAGQIDLVILDLIMPEMNGAATFRHLKELDPSVCVLLCSGYSDQGQAQDILTAGARGFIQKPFSFQDVLSKVRTLLDEREI